MVTPSSSTDPGVDLSFASTCSCCKWHVRCCQCILKNDHIIWTKSHRNSPKISPVTRANWLKKGGGKKNVGEKSYKFLRENYVYDVCIVYVKDISNHVKARCYRSLKKNEESHHLFLTLKESSGLESDNGKFAEICTAHCSCKGGSGGHCNHVFALLYQLNDFSSLGMKDIPLNNMSCTSQPQTWHIPRAKSICPLPVMGTHFARSTTDQNERKRDPVKSKLYDARGADSKCGLKTEHIFSHAMDLKSKDPPPPFSYLLLDQEPTFAVDRPTVFGYMPVGSCLSYQLEDFGREPPKFFSNQPAPIDSVHYTFSAFPDIPILRDNKVFDLDHDLGVFRVSNVCREFLVNSMLISVEDAISLEKRTVLQSDCLEWVNQHKVRLTASNFGKLFKRIQMPTEAL
ncbi:hypothetical protein SNE40_011184 [Patella caerulea]|uniref:SWIM-type domain-containing protein n=1 Tax=Patella caerulea TaxID=87958 RepID=A0AAN8JM65_PATCE